MKKKMIPLDCIANQLRLSNELLASNISQEAKRTISTMIESLLMSCNLYRGFNNLYWLDGGCSGWEKSNAPDVWWQKEKYIIGPEGVNHKGEGDWVSNNQGEYARFYYVHSDLSAAMEIKNG